MPKTAGTSSFRRYLSAIGQDVKPKDDDTYDLGAADKRWAYLFAVIAILTSVVVGNVWLSNTDMGWLSVNGSLFVNGSINATDNISAPYFVGNGSRLVGITGATDTHVGSDGIYLYNESEIMYFNETRFNISLQSNITDANASMKGYVDGLNGTWSGVYDDDWINLTTNTSTLHKLNITNTSMREYVDGLNGTWSGDYDDDWINLTTNTSALIKVAAANATMKSYVDGLNGTWQDLNSNCSALGSCEGTLAYLNYSNIGNLTINGTVEINGNITTNVSFFHCFGDSCNASIGFNGSSLIIKVN